MPGPLAHFFAQYPHFDYNPANPATDEFYRLCDSNGWDREDEERQEAREGFNDALTMQFNDNYGTDANDLTKWQALCTRLGIDPVPERLSECRKVVSDTHVNLVDLVHIFDTGETVRIFRTVVDLSIYTKETGKFFPRENAHAGNLLNFLLRQIMNPGLERVHGRGRGRGRGGRRGRRGRQA